MDEHDTSRVHKTPLNGAHPGSSSSNPRSCVTCRKRKVKCDKRQPTCGNCQKAHTSCDYPAPGRAPRRPRKPPDGELLARLRKLEGVVQQLGVSADDDPHTTPPTTSPSRAPTSDIPRNHAVQHVSAANRGADQHKNSLDSNFGRLVIGNEGRSRYVNSTFWANLAGEVEDLKGILNEQSEEENDLPSPTINSVISPNYHGFLFGFSSHAVELSQFHPPAALLCQYWKTYEENCDPLVKMLHIPTVRDQIMSAKDNPSGCSRGTEALFFSIYYAAITSLSPEECQQMTGESRSDLASRYRFAAEQGLARANLLNTEELTVIQAFVLFLLALRRHEDARIIWSLCGLLVRMAMSLGLHRDASHFILSPFDTEIRRRLWWQICILDMRISEDHGSLPTSIENSFDTRFPLNINDADIYPSMTEYPKEREGVTEMTFNLIRFEVAHTFRGLNHDPSSSPAFFESMRDATLADKERSIEQCHQKLEDRYLRHCDMHVPMHWVICTVTRLIMAKMWLILYHPYQRQNGGRGSDSLSKETVDRLFITSLESIEYALLLEAEMRTVKWGWLFRSYCQWHALAFLLSELCVRTKGVTVQRAWRAVNATVVEWGGKTADGPRSYLWRPLRRLMAKAREARGRELATNQSLQAAPFVNFESQQQQSHRLHSYDQFPYGLTNSVASTADGTDTASLSNGDEIPFLQVTSDTNEEGLENIGITGLGQDASTHNLEVPGSPFFANHPPVPRDQWTSLPLRDDNNLLTTSWLLDDASFDVSGTTSQNGEVFGMGPDMLPAANDSSGSNLDATSGPQQSRYDQFDQSFGPQQKPAIPWEDFDDMVREYEGQAYPSNTMQLAPTSGGWGQRRPTMGETWL